MIKVIIYFFLTCILITGINYNSYYNNIRHHEFFIDNPPEYVLSLTNNQTQRENYVLESQFAEYNYKIKNPALLESIKRGLILIVISFIMILFFWKDIPSIKDNELDKLPMHKAFYQIMINPFIELKEWINEVRENKK